MHSPHHAVVPSVTKMLDYDRTKTTAALTLGTLIPLTMYLAWTLASLGGSLGLDPTILSIFTVATLLGSSIGGSMSLTEEWKKILQSDAETVPLLAMVASVAGPVALVTSLPGHDWTDALSLAGGIGSPLLYGVIPALLAWNQRKSSSSSSSWIPVGALGMLATGYVGEEVVSTLWGTLVPAAAVL